ncbi:hypothetical protein GUF72_16430 [Xanthomonas citri pv. citri]|uniref:Transmembrane protein n=1 Tax=Xanthomonas citri pv. citri TaxID=611301 RepID=A0A0U4YLN7_XANCI|nr:MULTISPECIES: hypothetical protein [Xanthomonas]AGH77670.1 hypothetical protein XAC29_11055 [Xanthomonas axonopodis Xac29-1]AJD68770.1 hypothetical protein J151_02343 [Xanthomonas citri subsp. citri A306]AJY82296.1 hypothetical protein J159_02332 [Xanthomonas citri pv. citri]AJY86719.1 hypothetical protein J158_02333 [Xanthomonas citri subsp. citri UI6]AJY91150.1 hypothetical protein J169_02340 [Xanthomonas citri pv. citri]
MSRLRKAVWIACAVLSWGSYATGMLLLYVISDNPYRWVEDIDPQTSADAFASNGDARIVTIGILVLLLLTQGTHALCTSRRRVRGICVGLMALACLAWMWWN